MCTWNEWWPHKCCRNPSCSTCETICKWLDLFFDHLSLPPDVLGLIRRITVWSVCNFVQPTMQTHNLCSESFLVSSLSSCIKGTPGRSIACSLPAESHPYVWFLSFSLVITSWNNSRISSAVNGPKLFNKKGGVKNFSPVITVLLKAIFQSVQQKQQVGIIITHWRVDGSSPKAENSVAHRCKWGSSEWFLCFYFDHQVFVVLFHALIHE